MILVLRISPCFVEVAQGSLLGDLLLLHHQLLGLCMVTVNLPISLALHVVRAARYACSLLARTWDSWIFAVACNHLQPPTEVTFIFRVRCPELRQSKPMHGNLAV